MRIRGTRSRTLATNGLFAAFSLGVIGWGLLHAWGINLKAGILFHALAAIPGLCLSGLALFRYRQHWPVDAGALTRRQTQSWEYRTLAFYFILAAAGLGIALLIGSGPLFLLGLETIGMVFVPWTRIPACRDHFFFSSASIVAGAVSGLLMLDKPVHPLYHPMAASFLLALACMLVVSVLIVHGNRLERMPVPG